MSIAPEFPGGGGLPAVPRLFGPRRHDVARIVTALGAIPVGGPRIAVITGPGGCGTTTLAVHVVQRLALDHALRPLYADLHTLPPGGEAGVEDVLRRLLRILCPRRRPGSGHVQDVWRSVTEQGPVCLLLDGAVRSETVRALMPSGQGHHVVVTSRASLDGLAAEGAYRSCPSPLAAATARAYLKSGLGRDLLPGEKEIVAGCGGMPLALSLTAARLASPADGPSAPAVRPRPSALPAKGRRGPGAGPSLRERAQHAVTTAIGRTYAALPDGAAVLYRRVGVLPAACLDTDLAAAAGAVAPGTAARYLGVLEKARLVEQVPQSTKSPVRGPVYRCPATIREDAVRRARAAGEDEDGVLHRALAAVRDTACAAAWLLDPAHHLLLRNHRCTPSSPSSPARFTSADEALSWLAGRRDTVEGLVRAALGARQDALLPVLVHGLWPLLDAAGDHSLLYDALPAGIDAARRLGDPVAEQTLLVTLGICLSGTNQHLRADTALTAAADLALAQDDLRAQARITFQRGVNAVTCGRHALRSQAAGHFTRASDLHRVLLTQPGLTPVEHSAVRREAALTHMRLARIHRDAGRTNTAIALLNLARDELFGLGDRFEATRALLHLAASYARHGEPRHALLLGSAAVTGFDELGAAHWQGLSRELLARISLLAGGTGIRDAETLYRTALRHYKRCEVPDRRNIHRVERAIGALAALPSPRAGNPAAPGCGVTPRTAAETEAVIRARLADDTYPRGTWLPSEQRLAEELAVSTHCVKAALARLRAEGLLAAPRSRGTYVVDSAAPDTVPARPHR
ncbi:GntR family transcriptional regulator [Streptomyces acidiscabies]|uniref:GntR family transcriptional regulator n=1 Tax=Streptomyces acidiscabies TaxID=42234 RepID=A0ABU4MBS8_9ACTN|nr:GntR family transcriptional regulator [Streptomyces acidiscabies]MDX3024954.1 GntR family transcriptional regulator [Streptomyces acidiscabies]